jgi:hypothetical protein
MNNWHSTNFKVYRWFLLLALVVVCSTGSPLSAQVTTSSILGSVTDTSGAAIPNVDILVKDVDRNLTKTVKSNEQGAYRVDFLVSGNYSVTVSVAGFKSTVRNGISLSAGVPATINVELSPGVVTESIQVTSAAPIVETSNAEIGTTIDPQDFTELPLVNRNAYTLLDLTPGVQYNTVKQSFGAPTQNTIINGGATNGSGTTNYYFEGAPNINALNNNGHSPEPRHSTRVQGSNKQLRSGFWPVSERNRQCTSTLRHEFNARNSVRISKKSTSEQSALGIPCFRGKRTAASESVWGYARRTDHQG